MKRKRMVLLSLLVALCATATVTFSACGQAEGSLGEGASILLSETEEPSDSEQATYALSEMLEGLYSISYLKNPTSSHIDFLTDEESIAAFLSCFQGVSVKESGINTEWNVQTAMIICGRNGEGQRVEFFLYQNGGVHVTVGEKSYCSEEGAVDFAAIYALLYPGDRQATYALSEMLEGLYSISYSENPTSSHIDFLTDEEAIAAFLSCFQGVSVKESGINTEWNVQTAMMIGGRNGEGQRVEFFLYQNGGVHVTVGEKSYCSEEGAVDFSAIYALLYDAD